MKDANFISTMMIMARKLILFLFYISLYECDEKYFISNVWSKNSTPGFEQQAHIFSPLLSFCSLEKHKKWTRRKLLNDISSVYTFKDKWCRSYSALFAISDCHHGIFCSLWRFPMAISFTLAVQIKQSMDYGYIDM